MRRCGAFLGLSFALTVIACAPGPEAKSPEEHSFSTEEARTYLAEVRAERNPNLPPEKDPTSVEEVFQILEHDDVFRLEGAARFMEGMPGVEALTVRAMLDLAAADVFLTVTEVLGELGKRHQQEVDRLKKKEQDGRLSSEEEADLKKRLQLLDDFSKANAALSVLAEAHLEAGQSLAFEAVRQYPKDVLGYRVSAYYYLLEGDWLKYEDMMTALEKANDEAPLLNYFRALESLYRSEDREGARSFLLKALEEKPGLVRAQAELVLIQDTIFLRHQELVKLRAMNPHHPIVTIAGPAIDEEFQVATALRNASKK